MKSFVLILLFWFAATAGSAAASDGDSVDWEAYTHNKSGQRLYAAGAYQSAALEFAEAYRLSGRAALLFNVAQAYRLAGDCPRALDFYRRYREADRRAIERTNVVERIAEMERCIVASAQPAPPAGPAKSDAASVPPAVAPRPAKLAAPIAATVPPPTRWRRVPASDRRGRPWSGRALAGGGALLAATGIYFLVRAADRSGTLSDRFAGGGVWTAEAAKLEQGVARDRLLGAIFTGVGGLTIATGAYLLWTGRGQRSHGRGLAVTPTAGGAEVAWSWRF